MVAVGGAVELGGAGTGREEGAAVVVEAAGAVVVVVAAGTTPHKLSKSTICPFLL